jgi:choline kinase
MILLILASGKGTRLGSLTASKPKCMVRINNKTILEHSVPIFKYFKKILIIVGYKKKIIMNNIKNVKYIENKDFRNTNMVESIFKARKFINNNLVIMYSDIIFDKKIIKDILKLKKNIMPINSNWLKLWKLRMNTKKIYEDAENILVSKGQIIEIGNKIENKLPKYQFMGILKIMKNDYHKLFKFYKKIKNKKIDFTSFLNLAIKNKIIKIKPYQTGKFWLEIDSKKDFAVANKLLKKN